MIGLKTKQGSHARMLMEAVEHMRQADMVQNQVLVLKETICLHLY